MLNFSSRVHSVYSCSGSTYDQGARFFFKSLPTECSTLSEPQRRAHLKKTCQNMQNNKLTKTAYKKTVFKEKGSQRSKDGKYLVAATDTRK